MIDIISLDIVRFISTSKEKASRFFQGQSYFPNGNYVSHSRLDFAASAEGRTYIPIQMKDSATSYKNISDFPQADDFTYVNHLPWSLSSSVTVAGETRVRGYKGPDYSLSYTTSLINEILSNANTYWDSELKQLFNNITVIYSFSYGAAINFPTIGDRNGDLYTSHSTHFFYLFKDIYGNTTINSVKVDFGYESYADGSNNKEHTYVTPKFLDSNVIVGPEDDIELLALPEVVPYRTSYSGRIIDGTPILYNEWSPYLGTINTQIINNMEVFHTNSIPLPFETLELLTIIKEGFDLLKENPVVWAKLLKGIKVNTRSVRDTLKSITNAFLSLKYGPVLTLQDLGALGSLENFGKEYTKPYTKYHGSFTDGKRVFRSQLFVSNYTPRDFRLKGHTCLDLASQLIYTLDKIGIYPNPGDLWDIVPLSFVVNWVFPIDDVLNAWWSADFKKREYPILGAEYSVTERIDTNIYVGVNRYTVPSNRYTRWGMGNVYFSHFLKKQEFVDVDLSLSHIIVIGALGVQRTLS